MKKIATIATLSLIGLLIITTIIMAFVPYSFKPYINDPSEMQVFKGDSSVTYRIDAFENSEKKRYNEVLNLFNKSFEESAISALFKGDLGGKAKIEVKSEYPSTKDGTSIMFVYKQEQKLMSSKNKVYTVNDKEITYTKLIMKIVTGTADYVDVVINVIDDTYTGDSYRSKYQYQMQANYADLVSYINDLVII